MLTVKKTFAGALAQVGTTRIDVTEYGVQLMLHGEKVSLTHDDLYRLGRFMVYMSIPSDYARQKGKEDIAMLNPPKTPIFEEGAVEQALRKPETPEVKKPFFDAVVRHESVPSETMIARLLGDTEELPVLKDDDMVVEI